MNLNGASLTALLCYGLATLDVAAAASLQPLRLPVPGETRLHILTPTVLELLLVSKDNSPSWNFVPGGLRLPAASEFEVLAGDQKLEVKQIGFKRRALYAPFKTRDLRVANSLYLELKSPIPDGSQLEIRNSSRKLWTPATRFATQALPDRWTPVIHINQIGYLPSAPKKALIGYYLGSLGELDPWAGQEPRFTLVDAKSGKTVLEKPAKPRPDRGFPFATYQQVFEADFSECTTPGQYRLIIPRLGSSYPFRIDEGLAAVLARTYALGLYHQRCGTDNAHPFTRFTHGPCHLKPAEVPDASSRFETVNWVLEQETEGCQENPRHTAPRLKNVAASFYPFVNRGPVDVRGGHHDAGDYSKYTINSAGLIHHLVFAADNFPGAADLDNLGLPESGDGKSDVLQEAKWEADFLARMQDRDGGFYFLVYPRDRRYENNVLPDKGDPQVIFPKNTAVTAAAVAALAQCSSSPAFKKQFPDSAKDYLAKARKGWDFLQAALKKHGHDGAYQKLTHYGNEFMHDDELAWAAVELYLATGEDPIRDRVGQWLKPNDPATRKWGWLRLFDAYGCAIRSYAFAARSSRLTAQQLDPRLLAACEDELTAAGGEQAAWSRASAYGTSFPEPTKRARSAGWYFSGDAAFDLAVALQLDYPEKSDPRPALRDALIMNLNYESGANPVNLCYLTGVGLQRQREIVHQHAQNDRQTLPPTGIPLGNIQAGFGWMDLYKEDLKNLSFPPDDLPDRPYPMYDRWADAFNLSQEFVILNQARALGYLAWLMAQTPLKNQPWKPVPARITGLPRQPAAQKELILKLESPGVDLSNATIVWEAAGMEPSLGETFRYTPRSQVPNWIEAEALLPDGRRVVAVSDFQAVR